VCKELLASEGIRISFLLTERPMPHVRLKAFFADFFASLWTKPILVDRTRPSTLLDLLRIDIAMNPEFADSAAIESRKVIRTLLEL